MFKEEQIGSTWARICDTCRSEPCTVYCRADLAYLCTGCDARIHAANQLASQPQHERVWICEACERAPAAFVCKADAASLCTSCDADIHSANPLASRHHRVPVAPIPCGDLNDSFLTPEADEAADDGDESEAASWLINPAKNHSDQLTNGLFFGGEAVDEYLDFVDFSSCQPDMEYETSNTGYCYPPSLSHSVSVSSMDVGVVPESTMVDVSIPYPRPPKGTMDMFSTPPIQTPTQLSPMDRKASPQIQRKEKESEICEDNKVCIKKSLCRNQAEDQRPVCKETDAEVEVDQMFSSNFIAETGYGIVPSF